jgi:hypothetical protein
MPSVPVSPIFCGACLEPVQLKIDVDWVSTVGASASFLRLVAGLASDATPPEAARTGASAPMRRGRRFFVVELP